MLRACGQAAIHHSALTPARSPPGIVSEYPSPQMRMAGAHPWRLESTGASRMGSGQSAKGETHSQSSAAANYSHAKRCRGPSIHLNRFLPVYAAWITYSPQRVCSLRCALTMVSLDSHDSLTLGVWSRSSQAKVRFLLRHDWCQMCNGRTRRLWTTQPSQPVFRTSTRDARTRLDVAKLRLLFSASSTRSEGPTLRLRLEH